MIIGGLVLAAGASTRFGGPKQLALLDGRALVLHAVDAQRDAGNVDRVAVVVGAHGDEVAAVLPDDVDVVRCLGWEEGLAASLRAGIAALADADWIVVTLADQPRITAQVVAMVVDHIGPSCQAVRATYNGVPGHPVALGPELLSRAGELEGDQGFRDLLEGALVRELPAAHLASPADVDVPSDLEVLAR